MQEALKCGDGPLGDDLCPRQGIGTKLALHRCNGSSAAARPALNLSLHDAENTQKEFYTPGREETTVDPRGDIH
jgi:hypothetical protein